VKLGSRYNIVWTSNLKNWLKQFCPSCDSSNVDLWVQGGSTSLSAGMKAGFYRIVAVVANGSSH
jgi:hypothetical protein